MNGDVQCRLSNNISLCRRFVHLSTVDVYGKLSTFVSTVLCLQSRFLFLSLSLLMRKWQSGRYEAINCRMWWRRLNSVATKSCLFSNQSVGWTTCPWHAPNARSSSHYFTSCSGVWTTFFLVGTRRSKTSLSSSWLSHFRFSSPVRWDIKETRERERESGCVWCASNVRSMSEWLIFRCVQLWCRVCGRRGKGDVRCGDDGSKYRTYLQRGESELSIMASVVWQVGGWTSLCTCSAQCTTLAGYNPRLALRNVGETCTTSTSTTSHALRASSHRSSATLSDTSGFSGLWLATARWVEIVFVIVCLLCLLKAPTSMCVGACVFGTVPFEKGMEQMILWLRESGAYREEEDWPFCSAFSTPLFFEPFMTQVIQNCEPCPICQRSFPISEIEIHVNEVHTSLSNL